MCGLIASFAYRDARAAERDDIGRALSAMKTRGPDGQGLWRSDDDAVAMGHVRLAIIDIAESGAQPMAGVGGLRIVFNGEIYNYRALRDELKQRGYVFTSESDTEVLLNLYREFGGDMMGRLRGMYAFAIWDPERRGMLLARDPFGIKPLYFSDDGRRLTVASQVKALIAAGGADTTADAAGIIGFYLWGHVPEPYTLYRGIRAVPAGSTMWIDASGKRQARTFFDLSREMAKAEHAADPAAGLPTRQALHDALNDTIRHHLVADVPVGVFLSSGLDSTTIARSAHELGHSVRTVTLGFEEYAGTASDEVPLAEQIAKTYGFSHSTVLISRSDFEEQREHLFASMDQPSIDGVNTYFVSYAAHKAGMKVALSGLGGDELFGGYASFTQIPRLVRFAAPFQPFGRAWRAMSGPVFRRLGSPKYAGLLEYGGTWGGAYLLRKGLFMPWELPGFLDADLVREGWNELQTMQRLDESQREVSDARLKVSALEYRWYMRNQLLRDADWASMAHSLELRTPFVDAQFFQSVVPLMRGSNRPTKQSLAACLDRPVPDSILHRPKTGFSIPVRNWLGGDRSAVERGLRGWARFVFSSFAQCH